MTYRGYIDRIIKSRGQWTITEKEYFEKHHIIPRCLGGNDKSDIDPNIIWLYPEEHYQAYKLLALENPTNHSLVCAWHLMCFKRNAGRTYTVSAEDYAAAKRLLNKLKGKPIICIETQEIFESIQAAGRKYGEPANIGAAASKNRSKAAGYHWAYVADHETQDSLKQFIGQPAIKKQKQIICIETQEVFKSVYAAAISKTIIRPTISYSLINKTNAAGGYHWAYLNDIATQNKLSKYIGKERYYCKTEFLQKYGHKINCVELNMTFDSSKQAARFMQDSKRSKVAYNNIMLCCKGIRKTAGGFHWEFIDKEQN